MAKKYNDVEQAQLDAQAERQFGLPPGTLAQVFGGNDTMFMSQQGLKGYQALQQRYGLTPEQVDDVMRVADRGTSDQGFVQQGSSRSHFSKGDLFKALAAPAAGIGAGLAFGGAAAIPSLSSLPATSAVSVPGAVSAGGGTAVAGAGGGFMGLGAGDWTKLGIGAAGDIFQGISEGNRQNDLLELQRNELEERRRQFDSNLGQRQSEFGVQATQIDPFTQQRSRQRQALLGAIMGNASPVSFQNGQVTGGLNALTPDKLAGIQDHFSPAAMASEEQRFADITRSAAPNYRGPNTFQPAPAPTSTPQPPSKAAKASEKDAARRRLAGSIGGY